MWTHAVFIASILASDQSAPGAPRDPRKQPLMVEDALFAIPDVTGRIVPVRDADDDGVADLMIVRGGRRGGDPERIDLVSAKSGTLIRALTELGRVPRETAPGWDWHIGPYAWDGGGDVDGDGVPDLLIGAPTVDEARGRVEVIAGKNAEVLFTILGSAPGERLGAAVAFMGDVDGDGRDEFALGAPQIGVVDVPFTAPSLESSVLMPCGFAHWDWAVRNASLVPGFVSLRDGRTGEERWRVNGETPAWGFGSHLCALGDLHADGQHELVVQNEWRRAGIPRAVILDQHGTQLAELPMVAGPVGIAGNLDAEPGPDLFLDRPSEYSAPGDVRFVSGQNHGGLFKVIYPDSWGDFNVMFPVGDLDADGYAEIAFGGTNFNLGGPGDLSFNDGAELGLRELTLQQALALQPRPKSVSDCESGCALVYSGRTSKVMLGVWGTPGSARGLGHEVAPIPDVNGDGQRDFAVADDDTAYVFAGPGPERK